MTVEDLVEYLVNTPITRDFTRLPSKDTTILLRDTRTREIFVVRTMAKMHIVEDVMLVLQCPESDGKMGTVWIRPMEHMTNGSLELVE